MYIEEDAEMDAEVGAEEDVEEDAEVDAEDGEEEDAEDGAEDEPEMNLIKLSFALLTVLSLCFQVLSRHWTS